MALSPRSPASLNLGSARRAPVEKSPLHHAVSPSDRSSSSSPFQTDTGTDINAELKPHKKRSASPLRSDRPSKPRFEIFDDNSLASLPPLPPTNYSPKKGLFDDTTSEITPASIPLPRDSPTKTMSSSRSSQAAWSREDLEQDVDARSEDSDDTRFSNFSAVPNADMTLFAALGNRTPARARASPKKNGSLLDQTPTGNVFMTPATSRRHMLSSSRPSSPTPRQNRKVSRESDTTNLLIDFTQQFEQGKRGPSPSKSSTEPNLLSFINSQRNPSPSKATPRTPGTRKMLNLLDFDLPPQPTPRSIPTITIRELESLKSNHLSEISSLKASLSGREAEVGSLKKAVADAERRVGEAQESLREERSRREDAEAARSEWEKKGQEVQTLLAKVKEECLNEEREKEDLLRKLEETQRAKEDAELRAETAASKTNVAQSEVGVDSTDNAATDALIASKVAAQLDEKMENLARELHAVYKKKHESKVATLKKTYESRADKKHGELSQKIEELTKQNEELQAAKDSSLSIELSKNKPQAPETALENQKFRAELEEQKAALAGLTNELSSLRSTNSTLMEELESERVEKGELVAAVDEMLALQSEVGAPNAIEDFRRSISAGSQTPVAASSRVSSIGMGSKSGRSGIATPGQSSRVDNGKSRMMSNLARMGGGR